MDDANFEIITVTEARRALSGDDFRRDIAFQNDVNKLLASLEELCDDSPPDRPLSASLEAA